MVRRWDIITIGNISRNRYWGESDQKGLRPAICTCTLVTAEDFRLLVDPSLKDADRMAAELDRRTGLSLDEVDGVFLTHEHADHHFGLRHFPAASWLAAGPVAEALNASGDYDKTVEPTGARIAGEIDVVPLPGHTETLHGLRFDCEGLSVVVTGDAAMNQEFFRDRRGYFNSVDFEQAARTIDHVAELAGIVIPGHDNYFLTRTPQAPA